jgi:hypothetical protein
MEATVTRAAALREIANAKETLTRAEAAEWFARFYL